MQIELKMFMKFKEYLPKNSENGRTLFGVKEGSTFKDLMQMLGMPNEEDKIIVINGISFKPSEMLNARKMGEGDTVALFPPIAGG